MKQTIRHSGVAGILYLIFIAPITFFEVLKNLDRLSGILVLVYILILLISSILYIVFIYGFKLVAGKYQNNLLGISSYILIISSIVYCGYFVLALIFPNLDNIVIHTLALAVFGMEGILFGIALLRLKPQFGSLATKTGVVGIIAGASFLSVIFSIVGILLLIPLYILTLMILFRAAKKNGLSPTIN